MTTVVDPLGTPVPSYNKSGVTIQSVTADGAGTNSASGSAPTLSSVSEWNVVLITVPDSSNVDVILPSSSDIGDIFELHNISGADAVNVWPSGGMTIGQIPLANAGGHFPLAPEASPGQSSYGRFFRKVSSSYWAVV